MVSALKLSFAAELAILFSLSAAFIYKHQRGNSSPLVPLNLGTLTVLLFSDTFILRPLLKLKIFSLSNSVYVRTQEVLPLKESDQTTPKSVMLTLCLLEVSQRSTPCVC